MYRLIHPSTSASQSATELTLVKPSIIEVISQFFFHKIISAPSILHLINGVMLFLPPEFNRLIGSRDGRKANQLSSDSFRIESQNTVYCISNNFTVQNFCVESGAKFF